MKVKEIIKLLKTADQDSNVYLSTDAEGNCFGTVEHQSFELNPVENSDKDKTIHDFIIIYPYNEGLDYEELN